MHVITTVTYLCTHIITANRIDCIEYTCSIFIPYTNLKTTYGACISKKIVILRNILFFICFTVCESRNVLTATTNYKETRFVIDKKSGSISVIAASSGYKKIKVSR